MRVYVEAYGCAQNQGEAHALQRLAEARGHRLVGEPRDADLGVLVTCGVIGSTEARMVGRWRALTASVPKVVVTGCLVPLRTSIFEGPERDRTRFVPIREQPGLFDLEERAFPVPAEASETGGPPAPEDATRPETTRTVGAPNPEGVIAEVVLAQGCTSACAYCFSRLARGHITSRAVRDVADAVDASYARGAREIRLTSLDTAAWGADLPGGERLPNLLDAVDEVPGDFHVRVGMMSPQTLGSFALEYFAALDRPRFFSFLHLPVQSGSDAVLSAMRRGYRAGQAAELIGRARQRMPDMGLATDVIVGFPGETEADFRATLDFVEAQEPEIVNVTRFSPRPFTPAARLAPVPASVAKERSRTLARLRLRVARRRLERWIGRSTVARVAEVDADGNRVGRLPNYLPVAITGARGVRLGDRIPVRVVGARNTYLIGRTPGGQAKESAETVHLYTGAPG